MDTIKFGLFLKSLRAERGLTQEELAERLGVAGRTVSRWETGANLPDLDVLVMLADLFEVDLRELIDGERRTVADSSTDDGLKKAIEYGGARERILIRHIILTVVLGIVAWCASLAAALIFLDGVVGGEVILAFTLTGMLIYFLCMLPGRKVGSARRLIPVLVGGFTAVTLSNLGVVAVFFGDGSYHNYGIVGVWYAAAIYLATFTVTAVVVSIVTGWRK